MQLEDYTIPKRGNTDLRKLIAEKMGSVSAESCNITTNITRVGSNIIQEEVYHCFGATVLASVDHIRIISEVVQRAREGLEQAIGHPLVAYIKPKPHSHHS